MSPRTARLACAAALLLAALSGCSGRASDSGPGSSIGTAVARKGDPQTGTLLESVAKPNWTVGDYWTYDFNGAPTTYVVQGETATDWIVGTDSDERAWADARDDVSRLGPQRKSDLAGSQGDERVEFFRWPLTTNERWTTRWDHQDVSIWVDVAYPGGATLQAETSGGIVYKYTYDAKTGWFGELHHYGPGGAPELVTLRLTTSGHHWKGSVIHYDSKVLYTMSGTSAGGDAKTLQPDASATDLWLTYNFTCGGGDGGLTISLLPADPGSATNAQGVGHTVSGQCVQQVWDQAVPGPVSRQWSLDYAAGAQTVSYNLEVLQRTRTATPVG